MQEQLYIAIYQEPHHRPRIIATFNHSIDIQTKNLEGEIARAGYALMGTKEELEKLIEEQHRGNMEKKYLHYIPLFLVPENWRISIEPLSNT